MIIPDVVIRIIDEYMHRSDDIKSAIMNARDHPDFVGLSFREWIFEGNLAGESFVNMEGHNDKTTIKDPATRIVVRAYKSEIEVKINCTMIPIRDMLISDKRDDFSWGYRWVTPFSRKRRHAIRRFINQGLVQDATSGCMNTFDSACDVAHDAITRWFHLDPEFDP